MTQQRGRDGAWGAAARDWAEAQENTMRPVFEEVLKQAGVQAGQAVLDVACGTGLFCLLAEQRGATVAGIDASPGQLAVARERLPNADLREGEMDALPWAENSFNLVSCSLALQYAADAVQALSEMRRVLRPGGTVAIITPPLDGARGSGVSFQGLAQFRTLTNPNPAPAEPPSRARAIFSEPGALEGFFAEAGLQIYADAVVNTDWDYPDLETALRGVMSFAPGVRAVRAVGLERVQEAISESLAPFRTPSGGYHIPNRSRYVLTHAG